MSDCIFCSIVKGDFGTELVSESEHSIAFRDINPEQKVHILVVPKLHYRDILELTAQSPSELSDLMQLASKVANEFTQGSFQLKFNTGAAAGQSVFHAHGHVLSNQPKSA